MFWSFVLPFLITVLLVTLGISFWVYYAPKFNRSRGRAFFIALLSATILFVPLCIITNLIVNQFRFGVFDYNKYEEIGDFRVERYMPEKATQILMEKTSSGFTKKYKIESGDIDLWLENYGKGLPNYVERFKPGRTTFPSFESQFGHLNWTKPADLAERGGYFADNGAGFYIWFSESEKTAYEFSSYW